MLLRFEATNAPLQIPSLAYVSGFPCKCRLSLTSSTESTSPQNCSSSSPSTHYLGAQLRIPYASWRRICDAWAFVSTRGFQRCPRFPPTSSPCRDTELRSSSSAPSNILLTFLQGCLLRLILLPLSSPTWCPAGATSLSCPDEPPSSKPQPPHLPCCPSKNNCPSYKISLNVKVTLHMWDFQGESPPLIMKIQACTIAPPIPPNKQKPPLSSARPCLLAGRRAPACQHFWWAARRSPLRISPQ